MLATPSHVSSETFANPAPERDYTIRMQIPEFTCLCPRTGQPDFATLELEYVPDQRCVELKSLKLYIWSFRDRGAFHEAVTNEIADHLDAALRPRFLRLSAASTCAAASTPRLSPSADSRLAAAAAGHPALSAQGRSRPAAGRRAAATAARLNSSPPQHARQRACSAGYLYRPGSRRYNRAFFKRQSDCRSH